VLIKVRAASVNPFDCHVLMPLHVNWVTYSAPNCNALPAGLLQEKFDQALRSALGFEIRKRKLGLGKEQYSF